jgi:hypothetical protein
MTRKARVMINDSLLVEALKYGRDLADECARVNWKKLEEVEEKVTKEVVEKLAKKLADLKVERRSHELDPIRGTAGGWI